MRFVPLIPSTLAPAAWAGFRDIELVWEETLHPDWEAQARRDLAIHALHLKPLSWGVDLLETALEALRPRLGVDFLVIRTDLPSGRWATSKFLQALEALLECTSGRGVKLALRPTKGAVVGLVKLLGEVRGEAVGFCWDASVGEDLENIADRLYTAVGATGDDFAPLQRTGYRWNMALPDLPGDARELGDRIATLNAQYPSVLFPAEMPTTALGRPVVPDDSITFGSHWNRPSERKA